MQLELSKKEFRRLLDMVYIGNWILNSTRGEDRFRDYDQVESLLFEKARQEGMPILAETYRGETVPSRAFVEGGIQGTRVLIQAEGRTDPRNPRGHVSPPGRLRAGERAAAPGACAAARRDE